MNEVFENTVLENKLTNLMDSKLEIRSVMTVDKSLEDNVGLTKVINRYTYNGRVEKLENGEVNNHLGYITFSPESYKVKRYQQTFIYTDDEYMQDPAILDVALNGIADIMANKVREEYFSELMKSTNRHILEGESITYNDVVDALASLGREVEDGLFIIMSNDCRRTIRKDSDFLASRSGEIMYTGQFGSLCGIPVLFSKNVPSGMAIITDKNAVRFFVKKDATIEQDRNVESKHNIIVYERYGVIALVDDTSTVILGKVAPTLTLSVNDGALEVSGKTNESNRIYYRVSDVPALMGENLSDWIKLADDCYVDAAEGDVISVAEADANKCCVASSTVVVA